MNQPLGLFQIKIHSAENLPKSDIIGDIHSYVKFSINSFSDKIIRETSTIKKTFDPIWSEKFNVWGQRSDITFELYDKHTILKDTLVGTCTLLASEIPCHKKTIPLVLHHNLYPHNENKSSTLIVSVGFSLSFEDYIRFLQQRRIFFLKREDNQTIYIPINQGILASENLCLVVQYEKSKDKVEIFLVERTIVPNRWCQISFSQTKKKYRIRKQHYLEPQKDIISYFAYIKLTNTPFYDPFLPNLCIEVNNMEIKENNLMDTIVTAHGWEGELSFTQAINKLHDIVYNSSELAIYFDRKYSFLKFDYEPTASEIFHYLKLGFKEQGYCCDIFHSSNNKRILTFYGDKLTKLGKQDIDVNMVATAEEINYPVYFNQVTVTVFRKVETKTVNIFQLTPFYVG
jgi:hypothetical protein